MVMAIPGPQLAAYIEKMSNADKDFRFMAASDLMTELQRGAVLDDVGEKQVVDALVKLATDKNGEVANIAVRCLGAAAVKLQPPQVELCIRRLCAETASTDDQTRDVATIAIKTVVMAFGSASTNQREIGGLTARVLGLIRGALASTKDAQVRLALIEVIGDTIGHHGAHMAEQKDELNVVTDLLLAEASGDRASARKKAIQSLGPIAGVASPPLFNRLATSFASQLASSKPIQISNAADGLRVICRAAPPKFVPHVAGVVPKLLALLPARRDDDDDLTQALLQLTEALFARCPRETAPFAGQFATILRRLLAYDPNYADADQSEMEMNDGTATDDEAMTENGDNPDDDDEDEAFSDDEDSSWKVRRSAARVLHAMITNSVRASSDGTLASDVFDLGTLLVNRFKDRDESVRVDLYEAYLALLESVRRALHIHRAAATTTTAASNEAGGGDNKEVVTIGGVTFAATAVSEHDVALLKALAGQIDPLCRQLARRLGHNKTTRDRAKALAILQSLIATFPGALTTTFGRLWPSLAATLADKDAGSASRADTLQLLSAIGPRTGHSAPRVLGPHLAQLVPLLVAATNDTFYKVAADALDACDTAAQATTGQANAVALLNQLFEVAQRRAAANDADQEVKERALATLGNLVANWGDVITDAPASVQLLVDRLRNETMRQGAARALTLIVASKTAPVLTDAQLDAVLELSADFLAKNVRALKLTTLALLDAVLAPTARHSKAANSKALDPVLAALVRLVGDVDLFVGQRALNTLSVAIAEAPARFGAQVQPLLRSLVVLFKSPVLQPSTLNAALAVIRALVTNDVPERPTFEQLLDKLSEPVYESWGETSSSATAQGGQLQQQPPPRQMLHAIATATAVIAAAEPASSAKPAKLVAQLAGELSGKKAGASEAARLFALTALGELGRQAPALFERAAAGVDAKTLMLEAIVGEGQAGANKTNSEEVRMVAATALGALTAGNPGKYLDFVVRTVKSEPTRVYLLLHALKEVIVSVDHAANGLDASVEQLWTVSVEQASAQEEGTRGVASECVGRLCAAHPTQLLPRLAALLRETAVDDGNDGGKKKDLRTALVAAAKYVISPQARNCDDQLKTVLPVVLEALGDERLAVRRVALATFNAAVQNKPQLVRDTLPRLLPLVYRETILRPELVREVEMGPFKHKVDDGLDLRKHAFECMRTLLNTCFARLDLHEFVTHVELGLADVTDIRMLAQLILTSCAALAPAAVLQRADRIVELLRASVLEKLKQNAVRQESDRHDQMRRGALATLLAVRASVPDLEMHPAVVELLATARANKELAVLLEQAEQTAATAAAADPLRRRGGGARLGSNAMDAEDAE